MFKSLLTIGIFVSALFSSNFALQKLEHNRLPLEVSEQYQEALYLPEGPALKIMSFGYRNVLSKLLWFNTNNYFGKQYRGNRNYKWLAHMCDLVTTLDPRAYKVYEFAALMLAWEANEPEEALAILTKGINTPELEEDPWYWKLSYLRGFTYMFFLDDSAKAIKDFQVAAKLPNAPASIASIAAKKLVFDADDPATAIEFLEQMLEITTDEIARKALIRRLDEAKENLEKNKLKKGVQQ